MQQMFPPDRRLFPDNPQQQSAPRFASNAPQASTQSYEPQARMQNTGSYPPVQQQYPYAAGQLQALHSAPDGRTPRIPVIPLTGSQQIPATAQEGTLLLVYTSEGTPVNITDKEMERALTAHAENGQQQTQKGRHKGKRKQAQKQESGQKQESTQKKEIRGKKEQTGKFVMKFSIAWCVFGVIGIISTALTVYEWVIVPLLVWLNGLIGGGA